MLTWQERHRGRLRTTGLAYAPAQLSDDELGVVRTVAAEQGLRLLSVDEFVHKVFFNIAWAKRGTVIGFNLPFDLSRLALHHSPARPRGSNRSMHGGWSFQLSANPRLPRLQIKRVNGRAAFLRFTTPAGRHPEARNRERGGRVSNHRGYFLDVAVAAAALLGRRLTLALAAELLQTPTRKGDAEHGGPITAEYLEYALTDTQVTWECYTKIAERYAGYRLDTPLYRIFSEASVGKAHLRQMGLRPWRQSQPDVPDWLIATILETYYGGRTECHIRRTLMPGVATDLTSEYPTVFVLQGLWAFLIAERLEWAEEDPAVVDGQLHGLTVERLLDPAFWPELTRLVQLAPDGDLLPTRADYLGTGVFNVALTRRDGGPAQWFTHADVCASRLATGRVPKVLRVLRFRPGPAQPGLRPIALAGRSDFRINPYTDDLIRRAVELRADIRAEQKAAQQAGEVERAAALDAQQQAMKIVANSVSYGTPIEMNVVEHPGDQPATVHRPDGSTHRTGSRRTEEPGRFFHPLLATLVAGAERLLLALVMRLVADRGGSYVFCDTDSLFVVATDTGELVPCPGGPHRLPAGTSAVRALSWAEVDQIAGRLRSLNPYGPLLAGRPLLKIEEENVDPATGRQWQIFCYSIASKRYALFRYAQDGRAVLVGRPGRYKRSEHGLGHLRDPTDPRPDGDDPRWRDQWWTQLLHDELGLSSDPPAWFDRPAVGRLAISSRHEQHSFRRHNERRPYPAQTRPFNFAMMAFPMAGQAGADGALVAPLVTDPARWTQIRWYPRGTSNAAPVRIRTGDATFAIPGTVVVRSYRDVYEEYVRHPEAKAAGPDGQPCRPDTIGLLQPRTITAGEVVRIGKETNRLADTDELVDGDDDRPVVYAERQYRGCGHVVGGRRKWCSEACRKRTMRRSR